MQVTEKKNFHYLLYTIKIFATVDSVRDKFILLPVKIFVRWIQRYSVIIPLLLLLYITFKCKTRIKEHTDVM